MIEDALTDHLKTCATTVCRAWSVERRDGVVLGFTDHDLPLSFDGIAFSASSGLSAKALQQTTGLSVDNSEAVGMLSDESIREADIRAGLFDGAKVLIWLVNWADVSVRRLIFRGTLGEMEREGAQFRVELRGLSEDLNAPSGRVYQSGCDAVLGDTRCGVDLDDPAFHAEADILSIDGGVKFVLPELSSHEDGWFFRGRIRVLDGAGAGAVGIIKRDRSSTAGRLIETWEYLSAGVSVGDRVRLEAGCDKARETCREKFQNFSNFRGFPDVPGEDWLMSYPTSTSDNDGGSRRS